MPKKVEELISEKLTGDTQKNALDFITHVRTHADVFTISMCGDEESMCTIILWNTHYTRSHSPVCKIYICGGTRWIA